MTFDGRQWDGIRGAGGLYTATGEEIILDTATNPYPTGENIALHEFAHSVMDVGLIKAAMDRYNAVYRAFDAATASGRWNGVYAGATAQEYWAVGVQAYYGETAVAMAHANGGVTTRSALQSYDPLLHDAIAGVLATDTWTPGSFLGTGSDESFTLTQHDDFVFGDGGNDVFSASGGNDYVVGDAGRDALSFSVLRSQATVARVGSDWQVTSPDGVDRLTEVERLRFSDGTLALDTKGSAGQMYRLYEAAFDRKPDAPGLGYWVDELDQGKGDLAWVANNFILSSEFRAMYGSP
jgi:Ca2+-binding RTX toxin-like protein